MQGQHEVHVSSYHLEIIHEVEQHIEEADDVGVAVIALIVHGVIASYLYESSTLVYSTNFDGHQP